MTNEAKRENWIMHVQRVENHLRYIQNHDPEAFAAMIAALPPGAGDLITRAMADAEAAWNEYQG